LWLGAPLPALPYLSFLARVKAFGEIDLGVAADERLARYGPVLEACLPA